MRTATAFAGLLVVLAGLHGCARQAPIDTGAPSAAAPERLATPSGWLDGPGTAFAVGADSRITVRVYRAGRLARLGHNHVVEVSGLGGRLLQGADGSAAAELHFPVAALVVDDAQARVRAGEAFASTPGADAVAATRRNMLGPRVLDAANWPEIRVLARIADLDAAQAQVELHLSLRGVGRRYQVPVRVSRGEGTVRVAGSLTLRHSDFAIEPFAVFAGALQVRDELEVDFQIVGHNPRAAL